MKHKNIMLQFLYFTDIRKIMGRIATFGIFGNSGVSCFICPRCNYPIEPCEKKCCYCGQPFTNKQSAK